MFSRRISRSGVPVKAKQIPAGTFRYTDNSYLLIQIYLNLLNKKTLTAQKESGTEIVYVYFPVRPTRLNNKPKGGCLKCVKQH